MKKEKRKKIKNYIEEVFRKMVELFPPDIIYSFRYKEEECNSNGGEVGIFYDVLNKDVSLTIYTSLYDIGNLTNGTKFYIRSLIAHEIGHLFIWELAEAINQKYVRELIEKTATNIGFVLRRLYEKKYKE